MTVKVPRSWEAPVNATLAAEIPKYPNARLLDWKALATDPSLFYEDGIHLRPAGAAGLRPAGGGRTRPAVIAASA